MAIVRVPGRRSVVVLLAAALALPGLAGAAWWYASPTYAVTRLQQAALSGDGAAVADRVDFEPLRYSLKAQLRLRLLADARPETSSLAAIGTGLALAFIDPMVDAAITPETVGTFLSVADKWPGSSALSAIGLLSHTATRLHIERDGLDQFRLSAAGIPAVPALLFCRDGLDWKLCAVDLSATA